MILINLARKKSKNTQSIDQYNQLQGMEFPYCKFSAQFTVIVPTNLAWQAIFHEKQNSLR